MKERKKKGLSFWLKEEWDYYVRGREGGNEMIWSEGKMN